MAKDTIDKKMEQLFEKLCDEYMKKLDGKEMTSADCKNLMEFLKDNGINVSGLKNSKISSIVSKLPFSEEVEQGRAANQ